MFRSYRRRDTRTHDLFLCRSPIRLLYLELRFQVDFPLLYAAAESVLHIPQGVALQQL
jgi:hypothetical protein